MLDHDDYMKLWDELLEAWPASRVESMTLEEYTNLDRQSSWTYWVEFRAHKLGSVAGGAAYKWGIYRSDSTTALDPDSHYSTDGTYRWESRFGDTAAEAYEAVHAIMVDIMDAASRGDLDRIEKLPATWPIVKWKVAFLYQNRDNPIMPPFFHHRKLREYVHHALGDKAPKKGADQPTLYRALIAHEQADDMAKILSLARKIWSHADDTLTHASLRNTSREAQPRQYWKLSAGRDGKRWTTWLEEDFVSVGWAKLGDLSGIGEQELGELIDSNPHGYGAESIRQAWRFSRIPVGSKLLINRGTSSILGVCITIEPYLFDGDAPSHPHQIAVEWDDTFIPCAMAQPGWRKTLIQLTEESFHAVISRNHTELDGPDEKRPPMLSSNTILYGPPGTGKTWRATRRVQQICDTHTSLQELRAQGRADLITFHQSYGYEEFVEGIRPVISDEGDDDAPSSLHYEYTRGAFKRIALLAAWEGLNHESESRAEPSFDEVWQLLVDRIREAEDSGEFFTIQDREGHDRFLIVSSTGHRIHTFLDVESMNDRNRAQIVGKGYTRAVWNHRDELTSYSSAQISKIIARTQNTKGHCRQLVLWLVVQELQKISHELASKRDESVPLTPEQKIEAVTYALANNPGDFDFGDVPQYVIVIDEINRGNVAKILGELMTLLEPSKRLGASDEMLVRLPYSGELFGVPPNLHVVGTMNTADRSIAMMDMALRRRFVFEECMPSAHAMRDVVSTQASQAWAELLAVLLETLNARIRHLIGRDYQLGHAYFMRAVDLFAWRQIMTTQVIPLLCEYAHGDMHQVAMILGCARAPHSNRPARQDHAVVASQYRAPMLELAGEDLHTVFGFTVDAQSEAFELHTRFAESDDELELLEFLRCCLTGDQEVCDRVEEELAR